jgi:hypothetical protein
MVYFFSRLLPSMLSKDIASRLAVRPNLGHYDYAQGTKDSLRRLLDALNQLIKGRTGDSSTEISRKSYLLYLLTLKKVGSALLQTNFDTCRLKITSSPRGFPRLACEPPHHATPDWTPGLSANKAGFSCSYK